MKHQSLWVALALTFTLATGCTKSTPPADSSSAAPAGQVESGGTGGPTTGNPGGNAGEGGEHTHGKGINRVLDQLDLTPDQRDKITKIQADHQGDDDRRAMYEAINAVLTPEQQAKMKEIRGRRRHRHHQEGEGGDASPSAAPDQH